ncbi:MAG: hypothetical protein DWP97_09515 [Calditrichaeota bacterium]|nr:MAG: hypothetical protein DWP97_09515 [Calditrichota bacterium]
MFKSIITFLIIIILSGSAYAAKSATDKGCKIVKVNASILYQDGDLYETGAKGQTTINLAPSFLFFTGKGVYLGPEFRYNSYHNNTYDYSEIGIGPQLGFILNPKTALQQNSNYSLYYLAFTAQYYRTTSEEQSYYYDYYYGYSYPYSYEVESNTISLGTTLGLYNMVATHYALDINFKLSVEFNNRTGSSQDETGYSLLVGFGLAGFSF